MAIMAIIVVSLPLIARKSMVLLAVSHTIYTPAHGDPFVHAFIT